MEDLSSVFLTSVLSLFAMAGASFFTTFLIFKNNFRSLADISFANCWMAIGLTHFLMAIRMTFFGLGMSNFDKALAYLVQFLLIFVLIAVAYYVVIVSFKSRIVRSAFMLFVFLVIIVFLTILLNFGLVGPIVSEWGSEYTATPQANAVLMFVNLVGLGVLLYSSIRILRQNKKDRNSKRLFANISLFLYLFFAIFEQLGNEGWEVFLVRILILASILMAYTTYELEKYRYS